MSQFVHEVHSFLGVAVLRFEAAQVLCQGLKKNRTSHALIALMEREPFCSILLVLRLL